MKGYFMLKILLKPRTFSVRGHENMADAISKVKKQYRLTGDNLSLAKNQQTYVDPFGRKINIICSEDGDHFLLRKVTSLGDGLNRIKRLFRVEGKKNIFNSTETNGKPIRGRRTYIGEFGESVEIRHNPNSRLVIERVPDHHSFDSLEPEFWKKAFAGIEKDYSKTTRGNVTILNRSVTETRFLHIPESYSTLVPVPTKVKPDYRVRPVQGTQA